MLYMSVTDKGKPLPSIARKASEFRAEKYHADDTAKN